MNLKPKFKDFKNVISYVYFGFILNFILIIIIVKGSEKSNYDR